MKRDRRTVLIGAADLEAAVLLGARQEQRPACAGGSCGPLPINRGGMASNSWMAVWSTNPMPVLVQSEPRTNR